MSKFDQGHWYHPDGRSCHTVKAADGSDRPTTLRDARKLGLVPSVTTILRIMAKPAVEDWKLDCALDAAWSNPRKPSDDPENWKAYILGLLDTNQRSTQDFGTRIHALAEHILADNGKAPGLFSPMVQGIEGWVKPLEDWYAANVEQVYAVEQTVVDAEMGYAGRFDAHIRHKQHGDVVLDFKTQAVKQKPRTYPEWASQLTAYSRQLGKVGPSAPGLRDLVATYPRCLSIVINSVKPEAPHEHLWSPEDEEQGWNTFTHALRLWQAVKGYTPAMKEAA